MKRVTEMRRFIGYARVSTAKQGQSGLGLEAQQVAIAAHAADGKLLGTYVEVESGKRDDRPELRKALAHAKAVGAVLIVAKLDRLSRSVSFIATLLESGVEFVACDMPHANKFMLHVMSAVAEHEREAISQRTRVALAAAKARGAKLGGFKGYVPTAADCAASQAVRSAAANTRAAALAPVLDELRGAGATSLRQLAEGLNSRGITTPRGGTWSAVQVQRLIARAA